MLTIIICSLIGAIFFAWLCRDEGALILGGFAGLTLGAVVGLIIAVIIGMRTPTEEEITQIKEIQLVALQDNSGISGSFFLGSGVIKEKFYYVYYYRNEDGSFSLGKILAEKARVFEENRKDGILEKIEITEKPKVDKISRWALPPCMYVKEKYIFRIPKGSIRNDFKLDLN